MKRSGLTGIEVAIVAIVITIVAHFSYGSTAEVVDVNTTKSAK